VAVLLLALAHWQTRAVDHHIQEENVERMFFLMMNSSALEGLIDCNDETWKLASKT
jgi:hypothetical protein